MHDKIKGISLILLLGSIAASVILPNTGWASPVWGAVLMVAGFGLLIWADQVEALVKALLGKITAEQNSDNK